MKVSEGQESRALGRAWIPEGIEYPVRALQSAGDIHGARLNGPAIGKLIGPRRISPAYVIPSNLHSALLSLIPET